MAQIDIKNTTIRFLDGRQATLLSDHTAAEADLLFTAQPHIGSLLPRITFTDPAALSQPLAITVSEYDIDISLATDGAGLITSIASDVVTALPLVPAAVALVSVALAPAELGTGLLNALAQATMALGPRSLRLNVGEGNVTWSEKKAREYTRDTGTLDTVRNADEDPVEVTFDALWDFLKADVGFQVTVSDVLKKRGEASVWITSDQGDICQPYSVDIEIEFNPDCSPITKEYYIIPKFRYEDIGHDLSGGALAFTGKSNVTEIIIHRSVR